MTQGTPATGPPIRITFGNGQRRLLCPADPEAAAVVERLAGVMHLSAGGSGQEIFVSVQEAKKEISSLPGAGDPVIAILPPGMNAELRVIQMTDLAKTIAASLLPCQGILLHGALVERDGYGVLLAGPGCVGKSTAARRIPPPWRALSDDAAFVVPDSSGYFRAHPWPTWSRFYEDGPGGSWETERSVPLRAIFFLRQAPADSAEPVAASDATALLVESIHQVMGPPVALRPDPEYSRSLCTLELAAVSSLASSVPVHYLNISLTGRFWEAIEQAPGVCRAEAAPPDGGQQEPAPDGGSRNPIVGPGHLPLVYTGPSMNPVLEEPELLDVLPYGTGSPRVGDVICFHAPFKKPIVVHRITGISPAGIRTQGDNNPVPDPYLVRPADVIGRVVAAGRSGRRRTIAGGTLGRTTRIFSQLRRAFVIRAPALYRIARPFLSCTRALGGAGIFRKRQRVIRYSSRNTIFLRLFVGNRLAGEYTSRQTGWSLRFPYQILIDTSRLPAIEIAWPGNRPEYVVTGTPGDRS